MKEQDYTHEFMFSEYLDNKCPVCGCYVDSDDFYGHTESGGKCMAQYFKCFQCGSEYTIGFNRSRMPIPSEITLLNNQKQ